jgi:hypothetical protein
MGHFRDNWIEDTTMEFPRTGFWLVHVISAVMIFFLGMRFAVRRAPFSLVAYRVMRMLMHR